MSADEIIYERTRPDGSRLRVVSTFEDLFGWELEVNHGIGWCHLGYFIFRSSAVRRANAMVKAAERKASLT